MDNDQDVGGGYDSDDGDALGGGSPLDDLIDSAGDGVHDEVGPGEDSGSDLDTWSDKDWAELFEFRSSGARPGSLKVLEFLRGQEQLEREQEAETDGEAMGRMLTSADIQNMGSAEFRSYLDSNQSTLYDREQEVLGGQG